jgi:hypothetical protein
MKITYGQNPSNQPEKPDNFEKVKPLAIACADVLEELSKVEPIILVLEDDVRDFIFSQMRLVLGRVSNFYEKTSKKNSKLR